MVLLFRKRVLRNFGFLVLFLAVAVAIFSSQTRENIPVFFTYSEHPTTVVVDAGHGGEDGGAVSPDGTTESPINLSIALRLSDLFRFTGQRTMMTRAEDVSVHTEGNTIRARKVSDIHNRVDLINRTENAVLISIHQNSLPSSPVTHGAQVFWNQEAGADVFARVVQDALNSTVNTGNEKQPKKIASTIYLMTHVTVPAILIECGFLSNREETIKLQEPFYQLKLAAAITSGYLRCLSGEEVP